ncbi:hypothetical protein KIN20_035886 [Parelaphostrongylus tenuis]|uniref:legumain n=1 Tax=Parelaphostrongylus tenuis TaxID=148309 RepID=A0AAD5WL93_PARTN|nr:hypothetical protein KIN20_035886 [Parelaphostrongylus tenuis]
MAILLWTSVFALLFLGKALALPHESPANQIGDVYVVLVAGSNGWWNYRHQADVAHAYHLVRNNGVPEGNIIVMMYDDVAHDPNNPYPGKLFNEPNGSDVYHGLKIDYRGDSVTPKNFLNVLQGNADRVSGGNGRVLKSTANDRVFVYFTDHGASGLIAFPDDTLSKRDLNNALHKMHKEKRYNELVFYLEACESGSMFEGTLKEEMKIYAMTASSPDESSWATYCDDDERLPCLGDLFSVNWMQDSETHNVRVETLLTQYKDVRNLTDKSQVMKYGDFKITNEVVDMFEGEYSQATITTAAPTFTAVKKQHQKVSWPARDVELMHLHKLQKTANNVMMSIALQKRISDIQEDRRGIEAVYNNLVASLLPDANDRKQMMEGRNAIDMECHHDVVKVFDMICVDVNKFDYALKYIYVLNNLCVKIGDSKKIITAMHTTCSAIGAKYL